MAVFGLTIIVLGWLIQLFSVMQKIKEIRVTFVLAYIVGVALLVIDGFQSGMTELAALNFITLIVSALVIFGLKKF